MRVLRMMCGKSLRDDLSNQTICEMTGVEKIEEFMREQRLRWFGRVERMDNERTLVKAKNFLADDSKKDRPKKDRKKL